MNDSQIVETLPCIHKQTELDFVSIESKGSITFALTRDHKLYFTGNKSTVGRASKFIEYPGELPDSKIIKFKTGPKNLV